MRSHPAVQTHQPPDVALPSHGWGTWNRRSVVLPPGGLWPHFWACRCPAVQLYRLLAAAHRGRGCRVWKRRFVARPLGVLDRASAAPYTYVAHDADIVDSIRFVQPRSSVAYDSDFVCDLDASCCRSDESPGGAHRRLWIEGLLCLRCLYPAVQMHQPPDAALASCGWGNWNRRSVVWSFGMVWPSPGVSYNRAAQLHRLSDAAHLGCGCRGWKRRSVVSTRGESAGVCPTACACSSHAAEVAAPSHSVAIAPLPKVGTTRSLRISAPGEYWDSHDELFRNIWWLFWRGAQGGGGLDPASRNVAAWGRGAHAIDMAPRGHRLNRFINVVWAIVQRALDNDWNGIVFSCTAPWWDAAFLTSWSTCGPCDTLRVRTVLAARFIGGARRPMAKRLRGAHMLKLTVAAVVTQGLL